MPRPDNVPEHLWLSDSRAPRPTSSEHRGKVEWTPDLLARCQAMHEAGKNYGVIAQMIFEWFGVRVARSSVQDYMTKHE